MSFLVRWLPEYFRQKLPCVQQFSTAPPNHSTILSKPPAQIKKQAQGQLFARSISMFLFPGSNYVFI